MWPLEMPLLRSGQNDLTSVEIIQSDMSMISSKVFMFAMSLCLNAFQETHYTVMCFLFPMNIKNMH